jgi:hypothetical protein
MGESLCCTLEFTLTTLEFARTPGNRPFAPLKDVLAYKQMLLRPKDHLDIVALHQALLQSAPQAML